jgi:hypothetical protein
MGGAITLVRHTTPRTARALLALVATLLALIAVEFGYPAWRGVSRDLFLMGFYATPNSTVGDVRISSMGFAGDAVGRRKDPSTARVLMLGESTFFNRRMAERLKAALTPMASRHGKAVEVVGAALRTHTTRSSVIKFAYLKQFQFDLVLIYHGINDLWINPALASDDRRAYSHISAWYDRSALLDGCVLCRLTYNQLLFHRPVMPKQSFAATRTLPSPRLFEQNLSILLDDVRAAGATPVLMSFAWQIPDSYSYDAFVAHRAGYNNPENYDSHPFELWGTVDYVKAGLQAHNAIVRRLNRAKSTVFVDQERLLGDSLSNFGDVVHLSEPGTARFIGNIADVFAGSRVFDGHHE